MKWRKFMTFSLLASNFWRSFATSPCFDSPLLFPPAHPMPPAGLNVSGGSSSFTRPQPSTDFSMTGRPTVFSVTPPSLVYFISTVPSGATVLSRKTSITTCNGSSKTWLRQRSSVTTAFQPYCGYFSEGVGLRRARTTIAHGACSSRECSEWRRGWMCREMGTCGRR